MAYTQMSNDVYIANIPSVMNTNDDAIINGRIVDAGKIQGLVPANASGNIPINNTNLNTNLNADLLDGNHASAFATTGHVHAVVTTSSNGFMSNTDKTKLDTIQSYAEVNQNAFSNITVGSTTIQADSKTDTLTLTAGANISITGDATNDAVTISVIGTVPNATYSTSAGNATTANNSDTVDGLHGSQFVRNDATSTIAGDNSLVIGPNSSWGQYLRIGGNGSTDLTKATVATTNGNLHLDAKSGYATYINNYSGGRINFGQGIKSYIDENGVFNGTATYANSAGNSNHAEYLSNDSVYMKFHWNGQGGQPTWLWGGNEGGNMYVWNPANFSVNYANGAGNADTLDGYHASQLMQSSGLITSYTVPSDCDSFSLTGLDLINNNYLIMISGFGEGHFKLPGYGSFLEVAPYGDDFNSGPFMGWFGTSNGNGDYQGIANLYHVGMMHARGNYTDQAYMGYNFWEYKIVTSLRPDGRLTLQSNGFNTYQGLVLSYATSVRTYSSLQGLTFYGCTGWGYNGSANSIQPSSIRGGTTMLKVFRI